LLQFEWVEEREEELKFLQEHGLPIHCRKLYFPKHSMGMAGFRERLMGGD
jgi:hypothetical protein